MVSDTYTPKSLLYAYRSGDEGFEEWMRGFWSAFVLGMELRTYKEGMYRLRQLYNFGQTGLGIVARCNQTCLLEIFSILCVELVAMAVTL